MLHPPDGDRPPITGGVPLQPHEAVAVAFARVGDRYVPLGDFVREVQTILDAAFADEAVIDHYERLREQAEEDESAYVEARLTRYVDCTHLWARQGVVSKHTGTMYFVVRCERCGAEQDDAA